jgi:hypothetical protein
MGGLRRPGTQETLRREEGRVKPIRAPIFAAVKRGIGHHSRQDDGGCNEARAVVKCVFALNCRPIPEGKNLSIPKYALDILVCPVCKTRVELLADESGLKCVSCRRVYPIRDEIPVMLPEEATIAEEHRSD